MRKSGRKRLFNNLLKKGWERVKEDHPEGEVLRKGSVEILFLPDAWELYHYVSGELTFGVWYPYGRRQSQQLKREVERFRRFQDGVPV